jgi:hypothetical protein
LGVILFSHFSKNFYLEINLKIWHYAIKNKGFLVSIRLPLFIVVITYDTSYVILASRRDRPWKISACKLIILTLARAAIALWDVDFLLENNPIEWQTHQNPTA